MKEQYNIYLELRQRRISQIDCASIQTITSNKAIKFNRDFGIKENTSHASNFNF